MALLFDYDNIKVDFLSKALDNSNNKYNTRTILFPVLRYKVYAPSIESLELNIFQKNVLSLLNKGKYDNQQISKWLQLDTQLVQMIFAELIQKSFINSNGEITEAGRALIEDSFSWFNNAEDIKKDIYYIYQDLYSHNLYPVLMKFDSSHDFFQYEDRKIQINSKGKSKAIPVKLLEPKGIRLDAIQQPQVEEIFDVIKKHSKKENLEQQGVPPNLIQYIDNEATVAYLATTIYIEKEESELENIKVLDPFEIDDNIAFWLKDSLLNASKKNDKIKEVLSDIVIDAKKEKQEQMSDLLKNIHKEATEILEKTFDYSLRLHDDLKKSLEEFYRDLQLYKYHEDGKYLKEAFKNSQTVLETLFKSIYNMNIDNYKNLQKHTSSQVFVFEVEEKVKKISSQCEIPQGTHFWRHEKFNDIKKAMRAEGSLRAKYIGAILAAYYDSNNLMFKLMNQKHDILILLEKVAEGRNAVGHKYKEISDKDMKNYANEVYRIRSGIEEIIKIFLEGN